MLQVQVMSFRKWAILALVDILQVFTATFFCQRLAILLDVVFLALKLEHFAASSAAPVELLSQFEIDLEPARIGCHRQAHFGKYRNHGPVRHHHFVPVRLLHKVRSDKILKLFVLQSNCHL